jgi:predicted Zn-dependent protease
LKLIEAPRLELYALTTDPAETQDASGQRPQDVDRLRAALARIEALPAAASARVDDAAVAERLRALGYLGDGREGDAPPGLADPKDRLAQRNALAEAEQRLRAGEFAAALARFDAVLAVEPDNRFAMLRSGITLLKWGRLTAAIERLERAVALDPAQAETRFALADALTRTGAHDRAIAQWQETVRLQPRRMAAWSNLGSTLAMAGRAAEARAATAHALTLDPENVRLRANLAALGGASAMAGP